MIPNHQNPQFYREDSKKNTYEAFAPYNFVPLPGKVHAIELSESCNFDHYGDAQSHTGYIDCTFTTKTPLYTRTAMSPQFYKLWGEKIRELMKDPGARQEYAEFFHLDQAKQPLIPGSSLRGMIRSLVEIISKSKMKWVTNEPLVFRSIGDRTTLGAYYRKRMMGGSDKRMTPKMIGGYIKKDGSRWYIQPAKTIRGATFARIHVDDLQGIEHDLTSWYDSQNAKKIWVKIGVLDFQDIQGGNRQLKYIPVTGVSAIDRADFHKAVLAKSGAMKKKQREAVIFPPDDDANLVEIDEDLVRRYCEQLSQEQKNLLGDDGVLRNHQPVFYLLNEKGELVFFGHTMMFRLPYTKAPLDFVPEELRDNRITDLTEAIFGFVAEDNKDKRKPRAGRVYFCDGRLVDGQESIWLAENAITPKIMSGPKPTSFQHYLTQQEPDTVDTGERDKKGDPKSETRLDHYASPPPHNTVIRGQKLYWHKAGTGLREIEEPEKVYFEGDNQQRPPKPPNTQNTQIKPVKAGIQFQFRLHFENLRAFELGALLWALTLPGEEGKNYCHKLGMGKALGMGSIQLTVHALKISNRQERYKKLFVGDQWHLAETDATNNLGQYVTAFVELMTGQLGRALHEDERIKMLLKLLEYPGPSPERTRYMDLDEFKERPVLPDPLHITQRLSNGLAVPLTVVSERETQILGSVYSTEEVEQAPGEQAQALLTQLKQRLTEEMVATDTATTKVTTLDAELVAKIPKSRDDFVLGAYIQVEIKNVQFNVILCDTGVKDVAARVAIEQIGLGTGEKLSNHFKKGQPLKAWIFREINRKGEVQLTLIKPVTE
jgi:CRISPR-associated protein (TIGR03986 family)